MTSVEYTEEFETWWHALSEREQNDVSRIVDMLAEHGPRLPYPYCSAVEQSRLATCASCGSRAAGVRSASSTRSTRAGRPSS